MYQLRISVPMFRPRMRRPSRSQEAGVSRGQAVCVRLCDGFFFPVGDINGHSDLNGQNPCARACARTLRPGYSSCATNSDKIEDGLSRDGHPYSALPVAYCYTKETDNTCTCRRNKERPIDLSSADE